MDDNGPLANRLPFDVLTMTFASAARIENADPRERDNRTVVRLSSVCRTWRQVSTEAAFLWSFVSSMHRPELVRLFLERSRSARLYAQVLRMPEEEGSFDDSIPLILAELHRILVLKVRVGPSWTSSLLNRPAPILEVFDCGILGRIVGRPPGLTKYFSCSVFGGETPSLKSLTLQNAFFDWECDITLMTPKLSHLSITMHKNGDVWEAALFAKLFRSCRALESLELSSFPKPWVAEDWNELARGSRINMSILKEIKYRGVLRPYCMLFSILHMPKLVKSDILITLVKEGQIPTIVEPNVVVSWFIPERVSLGEHIEVDIPSLMDDDDVHFSMNIRSSDRFFRFGYCAESKTAFQDMFRREYDIFQSFLCFLSRMDGQATTLLRFKNVAVEAPEFVAPEFFSTLFDHLPNISTIVFEGFADANGVQHILHGIWPDSNPEDSEGNAISEQSHRSFRRFEFFEVPFIPAGPMLESLRSFLRARISLGYPLLEIALLECKHVEREVAEILLGPYASSLTIMIVDCPPVSSPT